MSSSQALGQAVALQDSLGIPPLITAFLIAIIAIGAVKYLFFN